MIIYTKSFGLIVFVIIRLTILVNCPGYIEDIQRFAIVYHLYFTSGTGRYTSDTYWTCMCLFMTSQLPNDVAAIRFAPGIRTAHLMEVWGDLTTARTYLSFQTIIFKCSYHSAYRCHRSSRQHMSWLILVEIGQTVIYLLWSNVSLIMH